MSKRSHSLEVFYDGACPLCRREVAWLRRRDRKETVSFIDIAAPDFDPTPLGKTHSALMAKMHVRTPDGTWRQGMEAFRRLYAAVGLGWLLAPTRLPLLRELADKAYALFARNRLRCTGRACRVAAASALCSALMGMPPAHADRLFPPTLSLHDHAFELNGQGVLRFARVLSIYSAALYLGEGIGPDRALDDVPRRLEVEYKISAKASLLRETTLDILRRNFSEAELAPVMDRVETIGAWWPDFQPGEQAALTYIPGRGTELTVNGISRGTIPGADFARMYFSIWLGEQPASEKLRDALLGGALSRLSSAGSG